MDHDIISELGGASVVGAALRSRGLAVADVTVRSWRLNGRNIPARYWADLAAVAKDAGKTFSIEKAAKSVAAPRRGKSA